MNFNPGIIVLFIGIVIGLYVLIQTVPKARKEENEPVVEGSEDNLKVKTVTITKPEDEKNIRIGFGQSIKLGFGVGIGLFLFGLVLFSIFGSILGITFAGILRLFIY